VLARIQKAVARSPAAAAKSAAAADSRVPLPAKFKIPTAAPTAKGNCFDLWDMPIESFADHSKPENHARLPRGITSGTISQAAAPLKSSHAAARIPHPGASYRPSVQDHQVSAAAGPLPSFNVCCRQDLIGIAVAREIVKQEAAEAALNTKRALVGGGWRAGADLWRNVVGGEGDMTEGQEGADESLSDADSDGVARDNDDAAASCDVAAARKPPRPKTAKERRRAAAAAVKQAQQKAAKEAKKAANRASQINPKKIAKEEDNKKRIALLRKQAKEQKKMDLGRRLGPQRMDLETPAVLLTEDIPQSFGRLKATVNAFEDRLRSLQERNLVEYRKPTKMRARYDIGTYVQRTGPKRCGVSVACDCTCRQVFHTFAAAR
jgi:hypothetical protein